MGGMFSIVTETWNPITGCKHNCVYCVTGDTLVLTADFIWKRISELRVGEEIVGFTEDDYHGYRYLVKATILNVIRRRKIRKVYLIKGKRSEVKATINNSKKKAYAGVPRSPPRAPAMKSEIRQSRGIRHEGMKKVIKNI